MPSIASVPALVADGRWAKGLGASGIIADEARADATDALERARQQVAALEVRNEHLTEERAELWDLVDVETRPG